LTCRHGAYDPDCHSYEGNLKRLKIDYQKQIVDSLTPDSKNYTVEEVEQVNNCVVMRVVYPNCAKCSYEGNKVMVFEGVTLKDVIKWKEIDPHFRETPAGTPLVAPSPVARFPASPEGWLDALTYAGSKIR
jgi:hypothetical protein